MRIAAIVLVLVLAAADGAEAQYGNARPGLRIGSIDGPAALTRIRSMTIGDDGRIYVLQAEEHHVKVFNADGQLVRIVGRRGEGPGEFRRPTSIAVRRDTLWVIDESLRRISTFSTVDFRHLGTRRVPLDSRPPGAVLADGSLLEALSLNPNEVDRSSVVHLARWDSRGERRQPFLALPVGGLFLHLEYSGPGPRRFTNPHSDAPVLALLPRGDAALLIRRDSWSGTGAATFSLTRLSIQGDTLAHRVFRYSAQPVTPAHNSALLRPGRDQAPPEVRAAIERALSEIRYLPPITRAAPGLDGSVWLARESAVTGADQVWMLVDRNNDVRGYVRLPQHVTIRMSLPDGFWAVEADAMGVEYLVRYTVTFPT
jgi:hypothetical protein